jgi:AAA domain
MTITFRKASKAQARARIALMGPAGSGKTYSSLELATNLGQRVALIDTERGSASKYADLFTFDVLELDNFDPRNYIAAIDAAQTGGYDVLVIDSLSHAWTGKGGVLDIKDAATRRSKQHDSFGAGWREASPLHNQLVDAMLQCRVHLIATMRTKTEYAIGKDSKGNTKIDKVGLAPVQRDGLEYEFDIVGDMDLDNRLVISKTRCPALYGVIVVRPDAKLAEVISRWLSDGVPEVEDSGRLGGEMAPPVQPAGANAARMRAAPDEATLTRQQADIATIEQIRALRDPGAARALWARSPDHVKAHVVAAVTGSPSVGVASASWKEFYKRASLEQWQAMLMRGALATSAAGRPPASAADPDDASPVQPAGGEAEGHPGLASNLQGGDEG